MKNLLIGVAFLLMLSACGKDNECDYDECAVKAPASEIQAVQNYLTANGITATQHCSGLFYVLDTIGTGRSPNSCATVLTNYRGTLTNGSQFDKNDSLSFPLANVILGWRNGIPLGREGGTMRLFIPPSLGYGNRAVGSIPANSILIFEIKLLKVF